jgi:hypothetical protein
MTFIDVIIALVIFSLFIFGFSQIFLPAYSAWYTTVKEYRIAKTIYFIAASFVAECAKPNRNMDNWKKAVRGASELESYEIIELKKGDELRALKLICIISGERLEIIGGCIP